MSNSKYFNSFFTLVLFLATAAVSAQGPIDGFFNVRGTGSVTASYTYTTYDAFYVADQKTPERAVPGFEQINQNIYSLYAKYAITDDLTVVAIAPYISASGDVKPDPGTTESEISGFQDLSLWAKYRPFSAAFTGGKFDGLAALGITIPGGYEPNGILSLGNGAFSTDLKIGGQLSLDNGFFVTAIAGYSFRGNATSDLGNTETEFDVPNAIDLLAKIGYASSKFYVEAWIANQNSTDGVDIMGEGFTGNFPETEVDFTNIGASVYVPVTTAIGLSVGYGTIVDGRNIGDASYFNGGVTFNF